MTHSSPGSGKMFIFTAPSGAGKTTIVRHILSRYPEWLEFSVSATTRARRSHEINGVDYYFMDETNFHQHISSGDFAEWEEVYKGQYYGTLKREIERIWAQGKHLVFDIDVQGALNVKRLYGSQCMSVFIKPPSEETLIQRLTDRNTESPESLSRRIGKVKEELAYQYEFDMILYNDLLPVALTEAEHIVETFVWGISTP